MQCNKNRPYRDMIRDRKEAVKSNLLDSFPLANSLIQLAEVHKDYFKEGLSVYQRSCLRSEARKLVEQITGITGPSATQAGGWRGSGANFPPNEEQIPFPSGKKENVE